MTSHTNDLPLYIDSDNALGSPFGDIDDGFALAALIKSGKSIAALSTVFGNTFEPLIYRNTKVLARICGYSGPVLRGASTWWSRETESSRYLSELKRPVRALALGPMTNFAAALKNGRKLDEQITELIFIGTNYSMPLPALRFIDFNQWKDPKATMAVFDSKIPLTCIPCDIARKLRVSKTALDNIPGQLGDHLKRNSARWFRRARLMKGLSSVPIWDLVPAIYALAPELFEVRETTAELGRMGQAFFGSQGGRPLKVVIDFDPSKVWNQFIRLVTQVTLSD